MIQFTNWEGGILSPNPAKLRLHYTYYTSDYCGDGTKYAKPVKKVLLGFFVSFFVAHCFLLSVGRLLGTPK
nr:MAG TPA: hypothetical protein [Caudoviricetes sp.]